MDNSEFQERVKRLKEVNEVIKDLDPAIREGALPLLAEYVTGQAIGRKPAHRPNDDDVGQTVPQDAADFFAKFPDGKPSDNAILIAAHLYGQYVAEPFRLDEVRETAKSVGLTIPASLDMTLKQAQREGKALFQHTGRSEFKPTVNGELYFKRTYEVPKGTRKRPVQGNEP
jgi:hypothetical protein